MLRISRKEKKIEENFFLLFALCDKYGVKEREKKERIDDAMEEMEETRKKLFFFFSCLYVAVWLTLCFLSLRFFKQNESHKRTSLGISENVM